MDSRKYYEAYDDRYIQVHRENLRWFADTPSGIVKDIMDQFGISRTDPLLEIGCGEGRDAGYLLSNGFNVFASDVSENAVSFCRKQYPDHSERFFVLDCITGELPGKFAFIYAVAVVHMLVLDADRDCFYSFIREHLTDRGIALICSMGDGITERKTDISGAFDLQERIHEPTGSVLQIASTSYRSVSFGNFVREIERNGLTIFKSGLTDVAPDYSCMMYAVVRKSRV